jgi:hypothetical protein
MSVLASSSSNLTDRLSQKFAVDVVVKRLSAGKDVGWEAEESLLLETVTKQRLMKTCALVSVMFRVCKSVRLL